MATGSSFRGYFQISRVASPKSRVSRIERSPSLGRKPRDSTQVGALAREDGWRELGPDQVRWTDDYSSILSVFR